MARIYVSSTYNDLLDYREAVYRALRGMRHDVIAMEDYRAEGQRPLYKCLEDVESCDLYIGIFAWRYGYVPIEGNPEHRSITELEYHKAQGMGKECLIFLLDETAPWPRKLMDIVTGEGGYGARIDALRQELQQNTLVSFFKTTEELANLVSQAVAKWQQRESGEGGSHVHELDRRTYLEQIFQRYGVAKLPIGPAEGLSLQTIFQPLALRLDPLAAEDLKRDKPRAFLTERRLRNLGLDLQERRWLDNARQEAVIVKNSEEALEKSPQRRLIILGGPGTGKTSTLKHFVREHAEKALADPEASLPIYLSLADLARSSKTLQSYLVDLVEDMGANGSYAKALWHGINAGHAFLCLDSLDEVEPQQRSRMIELVNTLAARPGNTWIVGSRFTEYKGGQFKSSQFIEWELQPLSHELRLELAHRLLPELQHLLPISTDIPMSPANFVHLLEQHSQAASWGENPLLFSLTAIVFLKTGELPSSRTLLYHEIVEAVLQTREESAVWQSILSRQLSAFALWLHQTKGLVFSSDELISFLSEFQGHPLGEEIASLAQRILRSGVIEAVTYHSYSFRHQTFQEYLAAVELARRLSSQDPITHHQAWDLAWSKRTYSRWTEVLRLMVGILVQSFERRGQLEAENWLKQLMEQRTTTEEDPGSLGLALALTSLPEFVGIMEGKSLQNSVWSLAEVAIVAWCEELIAAARARHITKCERLAQLREEIHRLPEQLVRVEVNQLFPALNDHDAYVRWVAVEVLGKERGGISLDILWNMLHDEDADVRTAVAEALTARGEEVPVDILLGILREENFGEESQRERVLAAQGERIPLDILFRMLRNGNIVIQMRAEHVLIAQGERVPVGQLLELLNSEDADVRAAAIRILGEQGERTPVQRLLDLLHDPDEGVRVAAVRALGKQGERVSRDILLDMLHDPVQWVRAATVRALTVRAEGVPLDILLEMLHDREMSVRWAAMEALGNQEGQRSPQHFLEMLKGRVEIRGAALQVVGVQGAITVLLSALDDPNIDMRRIAIGLLAKRIEEVPVERLLKLLDDEQWSVRRAVVEALGERVPVKRLLELLNDESWIVRTEVVKALAARRNRVPVEQLLEMLQDENQHVRAMAIVALGKCGKGVLRKRMGQEKNTFVQVMATGVLSGIERVSMEQLLELLDDKAWFKCT